MRHLLRRTAMAGCALALAAALPILADETASKPDEKEPFKRMTVDEVAATLGGRTAHVYDGNNEKTYKSGHVPGAVNLYSRDIQPGVLPADQNTALVFYCQNEL
jgi:3-mercaptopyruvate sulfurtransferase SseA